MALSVCLSVCQSGYLSVRKHHFYRPPRKPIYFGVMNMIFEVTKVRFSFGSITQKVLGLSTWILGSLGQFWGHWSITQNVLELSTWNLVQTLDWSGKMPIPFGTTGVNFGAPKCKKVKIAPKGVSCPALWCYIFCKTSPRSRAHCHLCILGLTWMVPTHARQYC